MGHGSRVAYRVQPVSRQPPEASDARRMARSSAWAVGSPVASRSLAATARGSPPLATTAPTGTSPFSAASSAASKARRIIAMSVSEGSCVSGAGMKPMIAVCPSMWLLWTEPGWDHTPGFASSPFMRQPGFFQLAKLVGDLRSTHFEIPLEHRFTFNLKYTSILRVDLHSRTSALNVLQISEFCSAARTVELML